MEFQENKDSFYSPLLIQKNKMTELGEIMDAIIHQWKQPLSILFVTAETMKDDLSKEKFSREEFEENVERIMEQLTFMSETADTFQNFFRAKSVIEEFNIFTVIENVRLMFSGVLYQNWITVKLSTKLQSDELKITGNPNEMQQVALNLFMNSKDAILSRRKSENISQLEGLIEVNITKVGKRLTITFTDNGGGVPEGIIDSLFNPYVTTKGEEGTGIGLYMSKLIVSSYEKSGMTVQNVENGAQFTISMDV